MECSSKTGTATKVFELTNYLHTGFVLIQHMYTMRKHNKLCQSFFSINYYYFLRPGSQLMVLDHNNKLRINNMLAGCLYFATYLTVLFNRKCAKTKHPKNVADITSYP